jgi:hypothetical protein
MNKGEIKKGRVYCLAAILIALAVLLSGCKENNSKETREQIRFNLQRPRNLFRQNTILP